MDNGWIKLHRKLQLKGYYLRSQYVHLWVHLLLLANHKPTEYMTNGQIIYIKEGQLVTGRKLLASGTGIPESTIEKILKLLEMEHQIEQQKTTKYRLITIVNWKEHQKQDSTLDSKGTTKEQQRDTNKKYKNIKKIKNIASQDDALINPIIYLFKEVNPSYQRLFGMPPQRAAVSRLLALHGSDKLGSMIAFLPKSNASRYAPTITTPVQFEAKLGELIAWSRKQKDLSIKGKGIA